MRLFCNCGRQLMIRHDIKLDVLSNFTYVDGTITITKHEVKATRGLKPFFDESEIKSAYCTSCNTNMEFSEALFRCDNCGNHIARENLTNVGDTLIICQGCIEGIENFEVFKIFGNRGPSTRTRNRRVTEALDLAREVMPGMPEEAMEMLSGEEVDLPEETMPAPSLTFREETIANATWTPPTVNTTSGGTDSV